MTVKDIVREYLDAYSYDGLFDDDCGCEVDDLMPCDACEPIEHCEPGHKKPCFCLDDGCNWHIVGEKP